MDVWVINLLQNGAKTLLDALDATSVEAMIDYLGLLEEDINPGIPGNPGIFSRKSRNPGTGKNVRDRHP